MQSFSRFVSRAPVPFTVSVALTAAVLLAACHHKEPPAPPKIPEVVTTTVQSKNVPVSTEYVAQTQSSRLVNIYARVSGFLDRRVYTEGAVVKEGEVLFLIDPKPFQAQLDQAEAALAKQTAAYEVARANLARTRPLTELNALSQKDLDDASGQFHSAAAGVEQAKAQVESARLNLSYCTVTSPVAGVTGAALQQDGTYISPQNSQLSTVMVLSPIWVNFSLSENEIQKFRTLITRGLLETPEHHAFVVEIILLDGTIFPHTGRITFAEPMYDSQSGTFLVRASVDNPDGILRPNQYVRVRLKGAVRPNAILVPQRSVQMGAKGHFVWVVSRNGTVEPRPVAVGEWNGDDWFINEGLQAGEQIVVDGGLTLRPGAQVKVAPVEGGQGSAPAGGEPPPDGDGKAGAEGPTP
ncbi:MAG: efflux RND transporter periplasmic adaptor subunit [bacterium]